MSDSKPATDESTPAEAEGKGYWNLRTWTMGGKQFWTDVICFHEYRIQKHAWTGHHRLVNGSDVREAWGDLEHCKKKLSEIAADKDLPPMTGNVVIVLHGLSRTRSTMKSLSKAIEEDGAQVLNLSYASTRAAISDHADALASVIDHLPEVEQISFVGHSMGNIVVRYYLGTRFAEHGKPVDKRFHRMVMLGPPNNGSQLARWLQNNVVFKTVTGESGQQLSRKWDEFKEHLTTPTFEFGIIAGEQSDESWIKNSLIDGKDDLVVTVEETKLPGASDFLVENLIHSTMMKQPDVHKAVVNFLNHGYFVSADKRTPIPITSSQENSPATKRK